MAQICLSKFHTHNVSFKHIFAAFVFQMVFLIISAYMMTPVGAVTCITIAVGVGGFAWAGFPVNHLDIAPQVRHLDQ